MFRRDRPRRGAAGAWRPFALAAAIAVCAGQAAIAQEPRFLAREDIILLGLGLRVEPAHQTVPKDTATIVSTFLGASAQPSNLPPFGPGTRVRATLRGPSLAGPMEIETQPNTPFAIPPLAVAGIHTLDGIRLESAGQTLLFGAPESVTIEVIDKLLVTQVTSRALTEAEIRDKGIVFDRSSFQAFNFTAAFAIQDRPVHIDFPVVLPRLATIEDVDANRVDIPTVNAPALPSLRTIIPDTLRIQTQVPNLSVIGFSLTLEVPAGQQLFSFAIPGVIVVPGNIGFLNQFFSVLLMVGNVAPQGSNLVVDDLSAEIVLPAGIDDVAGSGDDPLRMARTETGVVAQVQPIVQPGLDGRLRTADDVLTLGPGESGQAEYLVEGRREGTHVVEMEIAGTLHGLPIGPVPVRGRAAGSVLVRNPTFTLTFTHPETVSAGEAYSLDVTVTNTSQSPANFVSVSLLPHNVSGAEVVGVPTRDVSSIPPGDSAIVTFDLVSKVTGSVTAATLDSDRNVEGRFALKTAVGELGVPVSPDSLILPKESRALPKSLLDAAIGLLGKAWSVATAPAGAVPTGVARFSKQIVFDRAVEVAESGFRVSLHETVPESAAQLALDFLGSNFPRLPELRAAGDLPFAREDFRGFDALRRASVRGDTFARAVADLLRADLAARGPAAFHRSLAEKLSYRPGHLGVLASSSGPLPVRISIVDSQGRRLGETDPGGKVVKEIPFADHLTFAAAGEAATGEMALVAAPEPGRFTVRIDPAPGVAPDARYTLSVVVPNASDELQQFVFTDIDARTRPSLQVPEGSPYLVDFDVAAPGGGSGAQAAAQPIADPAPSLVGVVQQATADAVRCSPESPVYYPGRVIAVLFSEEVTPASVQDKLAAADLSAYGIDGNAVVGVALQPGRRIAFLALRDPVGPFIERRLTISGVQDRRGQAMSAQTTVIESTVTKPGGVVSGRVFSADGTPLAGNVRLFYYIPCRTGISAKDTDAEGRFSWDYVLQDISIAEVVAVEPATEQSRPVKFTVQRDGQRLSMNIVLLGRGTLRGRTLSESGAPLAGTKLKITSLTDQSEYGVTTDADGQFAVGGLPVGNVFVEAVHVASNSRINVSENIPVAGGSTTRDLVLLTVETARVAVKTGLLKGHVLRADGTTAVPDAPVVVYYRSLSQPGVLCPALSISALGDARPGECPVGASRTDAAGRYEFAGISAGTLRIVTFDVPTLQQGEAGVVLAPDGIASANILLGAGLGSVRGIVLDGHGAPVEGAQVGGGLSLVTTSASGEFLLTDVPVGRREIVAVSDRLGSRGTAIVDLVRAGEEVGATVVLGALGAVAGTIFDTDGITPVPGVKLYLFKPCDDGRVGICIVGTTVTAANGAYRIDGVPLAEYTLSAFNGALTAGNVAPVSVKFAGQTARVNVTFRGSGRVTGVVFDDDGATPLRARVAMSGERIVTAGGIVGTGFRHVTNHAIAETDLTTGRFAFEGVLVGAFAVSAVGQFSPDPVTLGGVMPSPNATVDMQLRLQPTGRIEGTVFMPDGVTPAGADVVVRFKSDAVRVVCVRSDQCDVIPQGIQEETVVTDASGRYVLPIVNAGPYTITADDPRTGRTAQIKGIMRTGETAEMPIRLLGIGRLTIRVLGSDATTAIPGARVRVAQLEYPKKERTFFADSQGAVVFGGADAFAEGEFVVVATDLRDGSSSTPDGGRGGRVSGRIANDGEQLTVTVYLFNARGTVSGRVFQADGLTPAANAEVIISNCQPGELGGCTSGGPLAFGITDPEGRYEQGDIPLGDFTVEIFNAATARRGFAVGRIDFNGQSVPVNVVEAAVGLVTGHVLAGGDLAPLKGAQVSLRHRAPSGRVLPLLRGMSSVDGSFAFPGTSVGTFSIDARVTSPAPGGTSQAQGSIVREGEVVDVPVVVNIARPAFGTIAGRIVNANGTPAAHARIEICHQGLDCSLPLLLTGDENGDFGVPGIPLGRFTIAARSQTSLQSASARGELQFEGETTAIVLVLSGLRRVTGTVYFADGAVAPRVEVRLSGLPTAGCDGACTTFADENGRFSFADVPAETFTVYARDLSGLEGAAGGSLNPGETRDVRVVLQPSGSVGGRVLRASGAPAVGTIVELLVLDAGGGVSERLFTETGADGRFVVTPVPIRTFRVEFQDPFGSGIARRTGTVTGAVLLGDVVLDEAAPHVLSSTPAAAAVGVPQGQVIQVVFAEPIDQGTVTPSNVVLSDPVGVVLATLAVSAGDTTLSVTPLAALKTETRYTLRVRGVKDRLGKTMAADYILGFTTVDLTAPIATGIAPAAGASGVPADAPVRIGYSEPIDPLRLPARPVILTGPAGEIDGRLDLLFGNTVLVFTPLRPLARGAAHRVRVAAATDLSGNVQPAGLDHTFSTSDGTPPVIASLVASNGGVVLEGGIGTVTADPGSTHDVAFVDFYVNDSLTLADRAAPFVLNLSATAALGAPGDRIRISAVATDTSGNRGPRAPDVFLTIAPDQPPTVEIVAPAPGTARNGDRIVVSVRARDDLGAVQLGFRAGTGRPQDAGTRAVSPPELERTESFAFIVPATAAPGSTIQIDASAMDSKGLLGQAAPVSIVVADSVAPQVTITGLASGAKLRAGQTATAVVSASDAGGVASIAFRASGVTVFEQTRTIDPAQNAVVASFTFTVPATARPGDVVSLDADAADKAGNAAAAARVLLSIVDDRAPALTLRTSTGSLAMTPGRTVTVIAEAQDEVGVTRVDLTGQGAFSVSDARQITPPLGSAEASFTINVPASVPDGAVLTLRATATDMAGNVSEPVELTLTARVLTDVTLPASVLVIAGDTASIPVTLASPAPEGGVQIALSSRDVGIASVTPSVTIAEGQTSSLAVVTGISGGSAAIDASLDGVQRASMTATVRGGVVRGSVFDVFLNPVSGAQVTVKDAFGTPFVTVTGPDGRYFVEGVNPSGPGSFPVLGFSVRVLDPATRHYGFETASLSRANGFAVKNVVLTPSGAIAGIVRLPDGTTHAGAGVTVHLFRRDDLSQPIATAITSENGGYEFPLVPLGSYFVDAADTNGNRGRAAIALTDSGETIDAPVTFLARATVLGTVTADGDQPVPNAIVILTARSLFGYAPVVQTNAGQDGTFRVESVLAGDFQVEARDPGTGFAGTASGTVETHGVDIRKDVRVAAYGAVEGTVYRSDGVTPVPNARVYLGGFTFFNAFTTTDELGRYRFDFVRLATVNVSVVDDGTRARGVSIGSLTTQGQTLTLDVRLTGLGTIAATVTDASGNPVSGATVDIRSTNPLGGPEPFIGVTGPAGLVLIEHVPIGSFTALAWSGTLMGTATGTLNDGQVLPIVIPLQPTASVRGIVYAPDGQTPLTQGTVYAHHASDPYFSTVFAMGNAAVGADGAYRIDGLPLMGYSLSIRDEQGRLRALARNVSLLTPGQIETRDLTFVGLGTVNGRVLNPDGSGASNLKVEVRSLAPDFGGFHTATTDAAGFYGAPEVVAGPFTVATGDASRQLLGEGAGTIARHEDTVTIDVLLQNNAITLPIEKYDANNAYFKIGRDGGLSGTGGDFFARQFGTHSGGFQLDLTAGGTGHRFVGATVGTVEESGREVVARQQGLAGLNVTRKVFVPRTGYLARYLEILTNPTAAPITVDVRVTAVLPRSGLGDYRVQRTSSGDAALNIADPASRDRWAVFDDGEGLFTSRALTVVFDGEGGSADVDALTLEPNLDPSCTFLSSPCFSQRLQYGWNSVTIAPGASAAFLHFAAQMRTQAGALAGAARLGGAAPEALAGVGADEIGWIRNFALTAGGTNALEPLPRVDGRLSGRLLEADGSPVVPGVFTPQVTFTSTNVLFDGDHRLSFDPQGRFVLQSSFTEFGNNVAVPVDGFTLRAVHPLTNVASPPTPGTFPEGASIAEQDVRFTNAALLEGFVRRHTGTVVTSGSLSASGPQLFVGFVPIGSDGRYRIGGIPPGAVTVSASMPNPQGTALISTTTMNFAAGDARAVDLVMPETGALAGTVRTATGSPASNVRVDVLQPPTGFPALSRSTQTDSAGGYLFPDVPVGAFLVRALEPATQVVFSGTGTIARDATTTQDLQLGGQGRVEAQVFFAGNTPAQGAFVTIRGVGGFVRGTAASAAGLAVIDNVPVGPFTAEAQHPRVFTAKRTEAASMPSHGATVPLTLTLPATGSVQVQAWFTGGAAAANAEVDIMTAAAPGFFTSAGRTDASGKLTIPNVLGPSVSVRVRHPIDFVAVAQASGTLETEGQVLPLAVTLPPGGTAQVQVNAATGEPVSGAQVEIQDAYDTSQSFRFAGVTDPAGRVSVRARGAFTIRAQAPGDPTGVRTATGTISTEGQSVPVTVVVGTRGIVRGRVVTGSGQGVPTVAVTLISHSPSLELRTVTDADGRYAFADVPVGALRVFASDFASRAGSRYSTLSTHGEELVVDVPVVDALLPAILADGNLASYYVNTFGNLGRGTFEDTFASSHTLTLGPSGSMQTFTGDFAAVREMDGRQLSIANTSTHRGGFPARMAGLDVTRKVHVSATGYFARYLEILENPGSAPIRIDLRVQGALVGAFQPRIVTTSDGDQAVTAADRWIVADDIVRTAPPFAGLVFHGAGAAAAPAQVALSNGNASRPFAEWRNLTIPAGGRAIVMHFALQTTSGAAALAAVERLVETPPEALHGLSPADRAAIVNFDVPDEGANPVAAFGTVTGRVLGGDGITPVTDVLVTVTPAASPIFNGALNVMPDAAGRYTATVLGVGPFTAQALDPVSGLRSALVAGTIASPGDTVTHDLTFDGAGSLTGTLRLAAGTPAFCCTLTVSGGSPVVTISPAIGPGGVYRIAALPSGTYSILWNAGSPGIHQPVRFVSASGIVVTAGQTTVADLRIPGTATVRVTAKLADGTPLVGHVSISDSSGTGFRHAASMDAGGVALIPNVPEGPFTIHAYSGSFALVAVASGTVTAADNGGIVDVLAQPHAVTISGTVRGGDGVIPIAGAQVDVVGLATGTLAGVTFTDVDGTYRFDALGVPGDFRVVAHSPTNFALTREVTRTAEASPMVVDFVLPIFLGSVRGTVFAADGETRVPFAWIELFDTSTDTWVAGTSSAADGTYAFANVALEGGAAFGLVAHSPTNFDLTVERTGSFSGAPLTIDFVLPIGTIRGTMYFADGTPVAGGDVRVTQQNARGELVRLFGSVDAQGRYAIFGLAPGEFSIFARDNNGMLVARASGTLASLSDRTIVDLHTGPSGTVTGTITTAAGAPVSAAWVYLASNGAPQSSLFAQSDGAGGFSMTRVPAGAFSIQACQYTNDTFVCGASRGSLSSDGQTVTAHVALPGFTTVSGTVYGPGGTAPVPSALVYLVGGHEGPGGWFTIGLRSDANGRFETTTAPAGAITVVAYDENTFEILGMNHAVAIAGVSVTIDVRPGATTCQQTLSGSDGFKYDLACTGVLERGGTSDGRLKRAYQQMYDLRLNGSSALGGNAATLELGDRQIAYDPHGLAGLVSSRKVFVPATGRFARYLDTIANPSAVPVTVQVQIEGTLGGAVNEIVGPSQTGLTYAVTLADPSTGSDGEGPPEESIRPALAHVFAGAGAAVPADAAHFQRLDGTSYYRWTVTVPAGESVTLMHFAVQRDAADTAGAEAQAQALVNLTDPDALAGLGAAQLARIVNFRIQ